MYDVIGKIAPSGRNDGHMLRDRVDSLSRPGSGCPNDFSAIKQFLSEYSDFAKGMLDRKLTLVAERKAKEQELAQQVKQAAEKKRAINDAQEREAKEREAEMRSQRQDADAKRKIALRSGVEKPASFRDYTLMHPYENGFHLFANPKVDADDKVYLLVSGRPERADSDGLLVKRDDISNYYVLVKKSRSTPVFGDLQINWPIVVIGKYIGNTQYTTVIGAVKTVAVIEAFAIAKQPVQY